MQLFDPAGSYPSTLIIDKSVFSSPAFNTTEGILFNFSIDHRGNKNNPSSPEDWGFRFYADGTTLTSIHYFSQSPDPVTSLDVVDTFGPFNLSNENWKFVIQELSSYTERGFKLEDVTLSTVPIPGAIWLLSSGLIGIVGLRKKF